MATANVTDNYLLELFKADIKKRLVDEGISAIRPAIEKAAEEAVNSLKIAIESEYSVVSRDTTTTLLLKVVK